MDEDIDVQRALNYPPLYKTLQLGRELNVKVFLAWVWASVYQVKKLFYGQILLIIKGSSDNVIIIDNV